MSTYWIYDRVLESTFRFGDYRVSSTYVGILFLQRDVTQTYEHKKSLEAITLQHQQHKTVQLIRINFIKQLKHSNERTNKTIEF